MRVLTAPLLLLSTLSGCKISAEEAAEATPPNQVSAPAPTPTPTPTPTPSPIPVDGKLSGLLVSTGDSIVVPGYSFAVEGATELGLQVTNLANAGAGIANSGCPGKAVMCDQAEIIAARPKMLTLEPFRNDAVDELRYPTAQAYLDKVMEFIRPIQAAGIKVAVSTPLPICTVDAMGTANFNRRRKEYRDALLKSAPSTGIIVIDFDKAGAADDSIACNTLYTKDGTHPEPLWHDKLKPVWKAAVAAAWN